MTSPSEIGELPDALDRRRALETFDRNLVVTAGAGTGKTSLLVERIARLLLREPDPLNITDIVALTFTNKAANEMKQRLRERLQAYRQADLQSRPANAEQESIRAEVQELIRRNRLSRQELERRVEDALHSLERASIGTIHSFAAMLLRLYPLEAGVDPNFKEDDGKHFNRTFEQQWAFWLDDELSAGSARAGAWRHVLRKLKLDQLEHFARCLCSEAVQLPPPAPAAPAMEPVLKLWLEQLAASAESLLAGHPQERNNEKLCRAAVAMVRHYLETGALSDAACAPERQFLLDRAISKSTQGWSEADAEQAQNLVRAAAALCRVDDETVRLALDLLARYVERFRQSFLAEGYVSFDGLLVRARNLVRDHPRVRAELKRRYGSILIDEFQDTDPIQYEILLYLAERDGDEARDWRAVRLEPGKVFVVGDPKQSIYAFRRADIEAYLEVVESIIRAQDGVECRLTANFRSHPAILDVVNGVFESLMIAQPGLQPAYIGIHAAPRSHSVVDGNPASPALPRVLLRKLVAPGHGINAEEARRLEGESLARWLSDDVFGRMTLATGAGERVPVEPRDVAILFRKLTDIYDYLEPLRRRGIRYVVEGERHFYAVKEVTDAVNLLRAIENPFDRVALVGVLRSPLGGLSDGEIYDLARLGLLDYRRDPTAAGGVPQHLPELYRALAELHAQCRVLPVGAAVSRIFSTLPIRPLAARQFHGEQAVANVEKLRRQAEMLGREDASMTFKEAIAELQKRVVETADEAESVLAEENVDAVRIMSIHKAKGLEFPIVVLAGCHSATDNRTSRGAEALFDWSSGLMGARIGSMTDHAGVYITEKARFRAEQEQKRVLYVGMTRAREHLVLSAVDTGKTSSASFMSMLDGPLRRRLAAATESGTIAVGSARLDVEVLESCLGTPLGAAVRIKTTDAPADWTSYLARWEARRHDYEAATDRPVFITPTSLKRREEELVEPRRAPAERSPAQRIPPVLIGELAHRALEQWEFGASDPEDLIVSVLRAAPLDVRDNAARIAAELRETFKSFVGSEIYAELTQARILGREVPLLMPWRDRIMEGVIDLVYEHERRLYLADYKTDRVEGGELEAAARRYRDQAEIYSQAVRRALNREIAAFKLIFLRAGQTIEIAPNTGEDLWLF